MVEKKLFKAYADYRSSIQQKFPSCFSVCFEYGQHDTLNTNTYGLLKGTWCLACMAEAFKACITASFMQISVVSAWRLRQKRLCACHTGSHVPQSPAASNKKHLNLSRRQSRLVVLSVDIHSTWMPRFLHDHLPSQPFQQPICCNCFFFPIRLIKITSRPFCPC